MCLSTHNQGLFLLKALYGPTLYAKSGMLISPMSGGTMHTHRFHLIVTTGLAICLGATGAMALLPTAAIGYPAGSSVSLGSNPVQSWGGTTSSAAVLTAPSDHDLVITDVHLSCNYMCETRVELVRSDGATVGMFWVSGGYGSSYDSLAIQQMFSSGLRIAAGQSMNLTSSSGASVAYTFSGYHAQP